MASGRCPPRGQICAHKRWRPFPRYAHRTSALVSSTHISALVVASSLVSSVPRLPSPRRQTRRWRSSDAAIVFVEYRLPPPADFQERQRRALVRFGRLLRACPATDCTRTRSGASRRATRCSRDSGANRRPGRCCHGRFF